MRTHEHRSLPPQRLILPENARRWCFQGKSHLDGVTTSKYLIQLITIPIKRHTKFGVKRHHMIQCLPVIGDHVRKIKVKAATADTHRRKQHCENITGNINVWRHPRIHRRIQSR
nr:hypothetical protein [Photorhabdus stackebrandtii]